MRALATSAALLLVSLPASAQGVSASVDSAAIIALEFHLNTLLARGAIDEYARHLTPDYARTTARGDLESREEALAAWRARTPGPEASPTDLWVRMYGDAAVLTGRVIGPGGGPGVRITKTFVRVKGQWLLAALHGSASPPRP